MRSWPSLLGIAVFLGLGLAAFLLSPLHAQNDAAADVAALREAKAAAAKAQRRAEALRQEAANAEAAADKLLAQRAALAAEIEAAQAQITAAKARIAIISRQQREQAALLGEQNEPLLRLNALLQNITAQPTALMLAQPGNRRDYIHLRATMASIEPIIARRTAGLRQQISIRRELKAQQVIAVASLNDATKGLAERRAALATLEYENRDRASALSADAALEFERAIAQGERARDLVERIDTTRESGENAAALAGFDGPQPRQNSGQSASKTNAYILPVTGRLISGFGELNPTGYRERGIRLAVAPSARIVAPAPGKISFAGRYRSFGNIIIIEHDGGWTTLVTNIEILGIEKGANVAQGTYIGSAGSKDPEVMIELRRNGRLMDIAAMVS